MHWSNRYKLLYGIFVLSGFAGLIYESIWSHYLKLFLGHAAYAQALVLGIFMGGMAIGAGIAGKKNILSARINLLYAYAVVELLIGVFGISFHSLFQLISDLSFNRILPELGSSTSVHLYKWTIGSLLILPQSILLGATFPLMTNGLLRLHPDLPGKSISLLYFGNSIGAAIGVLVSGFILIVWYGMPGAILTAGIINILVAIVVCGIAKNQPIMPVFPVQPINREFPYLILAASFFTGMASFIYELVWVRMLSMVLGASTHSFELMLSAFITGLAFGGLWIRNRIDRIGNPVAYAGLVQILMALAALSTLLWYNHTFEFIAFLVNALAKNTGGYIFFVIGSHALALLVMLPATFLAGMTLPLFTLILLRKNYGEKSIAHIYLCNMLGAVSGVLFISFMGMTALGIKGSLFTGGAIDMLLGIILLVAAVKVGRIHVHRVAIAALAIVCAFFYIAEIDPARITLNVFRTGVARPTDDRKVLFYEDGRTATVTVARAINSMQNISTNGKPEGSIYMNKTVTDRSLTDEATQVLLGALPLAIYPQARDVAVIGMGTGLTSQTILNWSGVRHLDTIEIEDEMIAGARLFHPYNALVFTDPRSFIHIEDARTYFSLTGKKYDLIISEPSNPWVSGVSSLFTTEFYQQIRRSLNADGYLVQWMQVYEMNTTLFLSILRALSENFVDYRIFATRDGDLAIIARLQGRIGDLHDSIFEPETMRAELAKVGIRHSADLQIRYVANRGLLDTLVFRPVIRTNSDYFPVLDLYAPLAAFIQENVSFLTDMQKSSMPIARILLESPVAGEMAVTATPDYALSFAYWHARQIYRQIVKNEAPHPEGNPRLQVAAEYIHNLGKHCAVSGQRDLWLQQLLSVAEATLPYLPAAVLLDLFQELQPACPGVAPATQQMWLDLFNSVIQHDFHKIVAITGKLLPSPDGEIPAASRFLFKARLLGLYKTGDHSEFKATFKRYTDKLRGESLSYDVMILNLLMRKVPRGDPAGDALRQNVTVN